MRESSRPTFPPDSNYARVTPRQRPVKHYRLYVFYIFSCIRTYRTSVHEWICIERSKQKNYSRLTWLGQSRHGNTPKNFSMITLTIVIESLEMIPIYLISIYYVIHSRMTSTNHITKTVKYFYRINSNIIEFLEFNLSNVIHFAENV